MMDKLIIVSNFVFFLQLYCNEAVVAQWHKRATVNMAAVGSIPTWENEIYIILIFRSVNEANHGIEFRHSTRNA